MSDLFDLVITGGQVVTGRRVFPATVAIRAGRIAGVLAPAEHPPAAATISADTLHILPGLIDTHVHLYDPARPEREDFVSGTSAAAAGGVTTILETPISDPPVNSGQILSHRAKQIQPQALVDFALYGAAGTESIDQIPNQAEAGAVAFKTFLVQPQPDRRPEFLGLCCTDEGILREVMAAVRRTGLRHCLHCEHEPLVKHLTEQLQAAGRTDGLAHAESRPPVVEDVSTAIVVALAGEINGSLHLGPMSSLKALEAVKAAKARGLRVTAATCPHYLFLTHGALKTHGPFAKCNPALRDQTTVEAMWPYLRDGTIDVIGAGHSPSLPAEKETGFTDIFTAPAGLPGLEIVLPLLLTAAHQRKISLCSLARLVAEHAAKIFHLPRKGRIAPGYDADLVLVDLAARWRFDHHRCFTKARDNLRVYHRWPMWGRVISTFVRGVKVYDEGHIVANPGHGRFVRPAR